MNTKRLNRNWRLIAIGGMAFATALFTYPAIAADDEDGIPVVQVGKSGSVHLEGAKIIQIMGTTMAVKTVWDDASVGWLVRTNSTTKFLRRYGESTTIAELGLGDYLVVDGFITAGTNSVLGINTNTVRDLTIKKEQAVFSGLIQAVGQDNNSFVLNGPTGTSTLELSSTTQVQKGNLIGGIELIKIGDKVVSSRGTFNHTTNTLSATSVSLFVDLSQFASHNFQGTLKSVSGTTLPTTLVVSIGGKDYNVALAGDARVMKSDRSPAELVRFIAGDTVRFFGAIQETNQTLIKAIVLRNLNL